jgi:hypothetical protein
MEMISIPSSINFSLPNGKGRLPIVEVERVKVQGDRKRVRLRRNSKARALADCSFGDFAGQLEFTAWQFFHAAKKTELASSFDGELADRRAFAFALENDGNFVWNTGNFRKVDRAMFALEDFANSGLAGRVGEAIAYLTMAKWGYLFWDRCATVWERAARSVNIDHAERLRIAAYIRSQIASGRPGNEPDFVFENANGEVALVEAKGSFVSPTRDNPSAKQDLKKALNQLDAWASVVQPRPQKLFGIGTYLREVSDPGDDPSLVVFVDPPPAGDGFPKPIEFPRDVVRRCNYGAWLSGMGFRETGNALRERTEKEQEVFRLPVVARGDREFAYVPMGWQGKGLAHLTANMRAFSRTWIRAERVDGVLVIGLSVPIMRAIERAVIAPAEPFLPYEVADSDGYLLPGSDEPWSIMPDGTFIGLIKPTEAVENITRMDTFKL